MAWADWGETEWQRLIAVCREDGVDMDEDVLLGIAQSYMRHGADGGGNQHGLLGQYVASRVDMVERLRTAP